MVHRLLPLILMIALLAVVGCSRDPADPEQQVRAVIAAAEEAAEDRSTRRLMRHVSENYRDQSGRDHEALRDLVRLYLLRHQNPRILTRIRSIEFVTSVRAEVRLLAGMADTGMGRLQADAFEITLTLDLEEDGEWRVIRAQWRRAGRDAEF
ncbi:hypothetical protein [Natronospira bacteriovora]|uniref:Nuclear transport factor 2 family protein n=1 Tax=Natronospira bacteriovora TaxID=3069753 RepID=A0ABU0W6X9_9GAMM|nr:hypothetical protein [Natronospira sp. AB-CW4]MDQ2069689.1 hypothetical protein [Natronospira sp. AB-CW4]